MVTRFRKFPRAVLAPLALVLLVAGAPLAAAQSYEITVETGLPIDLGASPIGSSTAAKLPDGSVWFAYSFPNGTALSLAGVQLSLDGTPRWQPIIVEPMMPDVASLSVAPLADGRVMIVWVASHVASVAWADAQQIVGKTMLPSAGFQAETCQISSQGNELVAACSMTNLSAIGPVPEVFLYRVSRDGIITDGARLISPDDGITSTVLGVASTPSGHVWVAYADADESRTPTTQVRLTAVISGTSSTLQTWDAGTPGMVAPLVAVVPLSASGDEVMVGTSRAAPSTGNIEVDLARFSLNATRPLSELRLTSVVGEPKDFAITSGVGPEPDLHLVEWIEEYAPDAGSAILEQRPAFALVHQNLSLVVPATYGPPSGGSPVRIVRGAGRFLAGPGPVTFDIVRVTVAPSTGRASPPISQPAEFPIFAVAILVAGVGMGLALPFATQSERLRWGALFFIGPLYAALRREKVMLDSMRRGAIVHVINANPGIRFRELSRRTGISNGALTHHVRVLEGHGFVERTVSRQAVLFFPAGANPIKDEPFGEIRARIRAVIRESPGITHSELSRRVGVKWSTLVYHADVMRADGKISMRRRRNKRRYYVRE